MSSMWQSEKQTNNQRETDQMKVHFCTLQSPAWPLTYNTTTRLSHSSARSSVKYVYFVAVTFDLVTVQKDKTRDAWLSKVSKEWVTDLLVEECMEERQRDEHEQHTQHGPHLGTKLLLQRDNTAHTG